MKKWMARLAAVLLCCCAATAAAEVKFDISVFENNPDYKVEFDEMDDTGTIESSEGNAVAGEEEDGDGSILGWVEIRIIEDLPPIMRICLSYVGEDWIFTDKVILKPADKRYAFEVKRDTDVSNGNIIENFALILTDESIQMVKDMIDSDNFTVKMRLDGDRKVDGSLIFDREKLTQMYNDYVVSGALENDFSLIKTVFPCVIK